MKRFLLTSIYVCGASLTIAPSGLKVALLLAAAFFLSIPSMAQNGFTTVNGTIVDPNGIPWAGGTVSAQLITAGGVSPTLNGLPFTSTSVNGLLGPGGTFSFRLGDNGVIVPGTTTWQFTINISPGIPPPAGKGPQSFVVTTAINCGTNTPATCTNNSINITATLVPVPALGFGGAAGGTPFIPANVAQIVPCLNNTAADTNALQAAINNANAGSGLVSLQGTSTPCSIDGTLISFGSHGQKYLVIDISGSVVLVNGGFVPNSFVQFEGLGTASGAWIYPTATVSAAAGSFPTFDIAGTDGVIISHLGINGNSVATVHIHDAGGNGPTQTTIRYSAIGARNQGSSATANCVRSDSTIGFFGLNLIGNLYAMLGTPPLPANIYISGGTSVAGDVWILSPEGDFTRLVGSGIELAGIVNSVNIDVGFTESFQVNDFITVDPGSVTDLNLHNLGLSDSVGAVYAILNKGATVSGRISGELAGIVAIIDPASTGQTAFVPTDSTDYSTHNNLALNGPPRSMAPGAAGILPRIDDLRRNGTPITVQYPNLVAQNVWNWSGVVSGGGCTVTHAATDPNGGANAISVSCTAGNSFAPTIFNGASPLVLNDTYVAGIATRALNSANGFRNNSGGILPFYSGTASTFAGWTTFGSFASADNLAGLNGNWTWSYAVQRITAIGTAAAFHLQLSADDTHPTEYAFPFVIDIPGSAGLSDAELIEIARTYVAASPSCTAGQTCVFSGNVLVMPAGVTSTVQTKRVSGCATGAVLDATCDTTVTWTTAFPDANYTAQCFGDVVTSGVPILEGSSISAAKTGAAITVRTLAITAAAAQFTTIDCTAVHD